MAKNIKEINVLSRWGVLIIGQSKQEQKFFDLVVSKLKEREWPFRVQMVEVGTGWFGRRQNYLETSGPDAKLCAYVGAETIGRDVYVGWSLCYVDPGFFAKIAGVEDILKQVDFNQANSARAFATSLNHAVQEAADFLLDEAGMDIGKVNREASGLLGKLI